MSMRISLFSFLKQFAPAAWHWTVYRGHQAEAGREVTPRDKLNSFMDQVAAGPLTLVSVDGIHRTEIHLWVAHGAVEIKGGVHDGQVLDSGTAIALLH